MEEAQEGVKEKGPVNSLHQQQEENGVIGHQISALQQHQQQHQQSSPDDAIAPPASDAVADNDYFAETTIPLRNGNAAADGDYYEETTIPLQSGSNRNGAYHDRDELSLSCHSTASMQSIQSTESVLSNILDLTNLAVSSEQQQGNYDDDDDDDGIIPKLQQTTECVVPSVRLAGLVRKLTSRERRHGIPNEYIKSGNALARRVSELFTFPSRQSPFWFWSPLLEGLMQGGTVMDTMVSPPTPCSSQPMPLLTWLCQHQIMSKLFAWKGHDDVVSFALAAGANPNIPIRSNASTPLFFAVKYGSLQTVQLLVKYGADLSHKDTKGRTCLWNAMEHPKPDIIRYLLQTLDANELFPHRPSSKKLSYQTAMDFLFASQLSLSLDPKSNPEYPWSYQVLGIPLQENVALAVIEVGKRRVTFSPRGVSLSLFSFVLRGDDPDECRHRYPNYATSGAKERLENLAKLLIGKWPQGAFEVEEEEEEEELLVDNNTCRICSQDMTDQSRLRLYCGHAFCVDCIVGYGNASNNDNMDVTCPVCHSKLCLEFVTSNARRWECLNEVYGVWHGRKGPTYLTSEQVRYECKARGIITMLRSDDTLRGILLKESVNNKDGNDDEPHVDCDLNLSIAASKSSEDGSAAFVFLPPKRGPVVINIVVKGIPVLAYISCASTFTMVSPEFVQAFQLQKLSGASSTTKGFKNALRKPSDFVDEDNPQSLIEELSFSLNDDIAVSLHNAVETRLPPYMGIVLGQDFLKSGCWCVLDVVLHLDNDQAEQNQQEKFVSIDGHGQTTVVAQKDRKKRKECLRYYAHNGQIYQTALLHVQPCSSSIDNTDSGACTWPSLLVDTDSMECHWCTRICFSSDGMHHCPERGESVFYCSEKCSHAALALHCPSPDNT